MTIQWTGPILGLITVLTIWFGHELVRKLNFHFGIWPAVPLFGLGAGLLLGSLFVDSNLLSGVLGLGGLTTLVDGSEIIRQEKRIVKGHAPENPKRPVKRPT